MSDGSGWCSVMKDCVWFQDDADWCVMIQDFGASGSLDVRAPYKYVYLLTWCQMVQDCAIWFYMVQNGAG